MLVDLYHIDYRLSGIVAVPDAVDLFTRLYYQNLSLARQLAQYLWSGRGVEIQTDILHKNTGIGRNHLRQMVADVCGVDWFDEFPDDPTYTQMATAAERPTAGRALDLLQGMFHLNMFMAPLIAMADAFDPPSSQRVAVVRSRSTDVELIFSLHVKTVFDQDDLQTSCFGVRGLAWQAAPGLLTSAPLYNLADHVGKYYWRIKE